MIKNLFKEIFIILLLIVVISLLLMVLLYEYNPAEKVVPTTKTYVVPASIKEELEEANVQSDNMGIEGKIYTVEGTDLNAYKKNNTYNPSKQNPYANTSAGASTGNTISNGTIGENGQTTNTQSSGNQGNTTSVRLK